MYYLQSRYYNPEAGRFISKDDPYYSTGMEAVGYNLYSYCGNNPIMNSDPSGYCYGYPNARLTSYSLTKGRYWSGKFSGSWDTTIKYSRGIWLYTEENWGYNSWGTRYWWLSISGITADWYCAKESEHKIAYENSIKSKLLTQEQKILIALVYAEAGGESTLSQKAVAHTIINRIGVGYWKRQKSVTEVITAKAQYSGYNDGNYKKAMKYLDSGVCTSSIEKKSIDQIKIAVLPVYSRFESDFTLGAQSYYSPKSMIPKYSVPNWAKPGNGYVEISINGIPTDSFKFYRLK